MVNRLYRAQSTRRLTTISSKQKNDLRRPSNFNNVLNRDIAAMKKVWKMLLQGSARWLGEVGRQY